MNLEEKNLRCDVIVEKMKCESLTNKCNRCGYEWISRTMRIPKSCPRCKSYYWNRERRKIAKPRYFINDDSSKTMLTDFTM